MTRLIQLAFIVLVACSVCAAAAKDQLRLAVMELQNTSASWSRSNARASHDAIASVLASHFDVIDWDTVETRAKEKDLSLSDHIDPQTAIGAGQLLGVDYLLTGSVSEEPGTAANGKSVLSVSLRLIDTKTGSIVWADEKRQERATDARRGAADDVGSMLEQLAASLVAADL